MQDEQLTEESEKVIFQMIEEYMRESIGEFKKQEEDEKE